MDHIHRILVFMGFVLDLKREPRTGWNKIPRPDQSFTPRRVKDAESVASHSYGADALWKLLAGFFPGMDPWKVSMMLTLHDLGEVITTDIVTATEEGTRRSEMLAEKKIRETEAMKFICSKLGPEVGCKYFDLWLEYEEQSSAEARMARQLDKLETALQAVHYWEEGEQVDPREFINEVNSHLSEPLLLRMLQVLQEQVKKGMEDPIRKGVTR